MLIHAAQAGCDLHIIDFKQQEIIVSIHAAQAGCDDTAWCFIRDVQRFQFTQPKRAATMDFMMAICTKCLFQFTQPKRAATTSGFSSLRLVSVSIHAAQAGCDLKIWIRCSTVVPFQFTQPKRAATRRSVNFLTTPRTFQFTQPKRAATYRTPNLVTNSTVSIHAAQAGCDIFILTFKSLQVVSIHAAQAGCD